MEAIAWARSSRDRPVRLTTPYSVATYWIMRTGGGDHAARRDAGDDVGLQCAVLLLVCGIEADEALSALRPEGTLQEIQLPADAGELPGAVLLRFPGP